VNEKPPPPQQQQQQQQRVKEEGQKGVEAQRLEEGWVEEGTRLGR